MSAFDAPWEAQVFALARVLSDGGHVDWLDVAAGEDYEAMLAALERAACERGLTDAGSLAAYRAAWDRASRRTPHGEPIELTPADLGRTRR